MGGVAYYAALALRRIASAVGERFDGDDVQQRNVSPPFPVGESNEHFRLEHDRHLGIDDVVAVAARENDAKRHEGLSSQQIADVVAGHYEDVDSENPVGYRGFPGSRCRSHHSRSCVGS